MEGVEPTRLAALDPKSSASANFATSAEGCKNRITARCRDDKLLKKSALVIEPEPCNRVCDFDKLGKAVWLGYKAIGAQFIRRNFVFAGR